MRTTKTATGNRLLQYLLFKVHSNHNGTRLKWLFIDWSNLTWTKTLDQRSFDSQKRFCQHNRVGSNFHRTLQPVEYLSIGRENTYTSTTGFLLHSQDSFFSNIMLHSTSSDSQYSGQAAMQLDIGWCSGEGKKYRRDNNLGVYCGGAGHYWKDCLKQKEVNKRTANQAGTDPRNLFGNN